MKKKKGEILVENIIFIVLNLVFLGILVLFLINQGNGAIFLEKFYAKQVALLIDSSSPKTVMKINLEEPKDAAEKNNIDFDNIIKIEGNEVVVSLKDKSSARYSFFNDVNINFYTDDIYYIFVIEEKT